jgi:hypothetical protein
MNWKLSSGIFGFAFLSIAIVAVYSQAPARRPNTQTAPFLQARPVVYSTPARSIVAKLSLDEPKPYEVHGKVSFTLTAANDDDTVAGVLVYTIPDEARKKIAQVSGKPLDSIPTSLVKKEVVAGFQPGATCPTVGIDLGAMEMEVAGLKLSFSHIVVNVIETKEEVPQLFCAWTRQINAKRQRRGIIASLNRVITGPE